jgi:DNA-binding SARP family transcriptional activator
MSLDGEPIALGGQKRRALLAVLLLDASRVVSRDRLIDALWGDEPPDTARNTLQVYVSQLRKLLPEGVLETAPAGYRLVIDADSVDLFEFIRLSEEGRTALGAGDPARAGDTLRAALALWRGAALADLSWEPFAQAEIVRLEELRLAALEERIDADLARPARQLVAELGLGRRAADAERFRAQLMLALYRSGRQADALAVYSERVGRSWMSSGSSRASHCAGSSGNSRARSVTECPPGWPDVAAAGADSCHTAARS